MTESNTYILSLGVAPDNYEIHILSNYVKKIETTLEKNASVASKHGEAMITALIAVEKGNIRAIERFKNGLRHDGPNGEAAAQDFNTLGRVIREFHFRDDIAQDSIRGEPAVRKFSNAGVVTWIQHFTNGVQHDGAKGQAAWQEFTDAGAMTRSWRYANGALHDGADGSPAKMSFAGGQLIRATRYSNGAVLSNLSHDELKDIQASLVRKPGPAGNNPPPPRMI